MSQVNTYFLHAPDTETPLEETLGATNDLYVEGKFQKFGISNYAAADVERIYAIAKEYLWILPTVYEGSTAP